MATALFKALAPRMMRDLMRDFSPLRDYQAAGIVGNGGGESGGFTQLQELRPISGRGGYGYFQWTGPRRRVFERVLRELRKPVTSYDANYEMLRRE